MAGLAVHTGLHCIHLLQSFQLQLFSQPLWLVCLAQPHAIITVEVSGAVVFTHAKDTAGFLPMHSLMTDSP